MLEAAAPVDAKRIGRGLQPRLDQCAGAVEIPRLVSEMPRLRERHELEVAIDLPQVLDVADVARIAVVEALAERQGRLGARLRIGVPLRRKAERDILERKDVKGAGEDPVRRGRVLLAREVLGKTGNPGIAGRPRRCRRLCEPQAPPLRASAHRASDAKRDFPATHRPDAGNAPLQAHAEVLAVCSSPERWALRVAKMASYAASSFGTS